ncbi:MAG: hypothetical protein JXA13_01965 [Anaerolineales bacterium]|nr:hypothetical protein [Anaerolineales bacterium]
MDKSKIEQTVIVTGDVSIDWNLARTRRPGSADDTTTTSWQRGGAALLADLVEVTANDLQRSGALQISIHQAAAPRNSGKVHPDNSKYNHSYTVWSPFRLGEKTAWRVEEYLGLNQASSGSVWEWQKVVEDTLEANLVILEDAGRDFRDRPDLWPAALSAKGRQRPWVLLRMARPLAQGPLWDHLHQDFSDRLILVTSVDDLRLTEVQISRELSWERTAQDLFWELVHNPCINALSHCAHAVISFGPAGAVLLSQGDQKGQPTFRCSLFFDPKVIEGMWEKQYPGGMIGYNTCLTAGIARQLLLSPERPDIQAGVQAGLSAIRTLHREGYGEHSTPATKSGIVFPLEKIAAVLAEPSGQFTAAPVQDPMRFILQEGEPSEKPLTEDFWTILQDRYKNGLDQLAAQIVLEGPEVVLQDVPWGQFGNLLTVDRQEIENFRSIRNLVFEYCLPARQKRPLSAAVFGSPGSGKSFGIIEIANSLLPGQIEVREFNLSQFDSVDSLLSAFHQVRDIGLGGKIPLIFWDEFDTSLDGTPLGWLRYFLAPMQDGRFQEGQISHPIGRAIFVFAGGTSATMAAFGQGLDPEEFRAVKGPDFVSRLKGYINVLGPNPVTESGPDPYFIIRRSILLRSILKRNTPQIFEKRAGKDQPNIDRGVLRALLKIGIFKHGARSIESLIAMSQLGDKSAFERSCLPAESQLDLHVDGRQFLSLVQQVELDGEVLESLAEAAHTVFSEGMKARGYKHGEVTSEKQKTHLALVPWEQLPEDLKEANRLTVCDIPTKLALAGYIMIPARSNEPPFNFPGDALEQLAEKEHDRWMQSKYEAGWTRAQETDAVNKQHKCLVPWKELSEDEREKDRDLVRGIPKILVRAGYTVVKATG